MKLNKILSVSRLNEEIQAGYVSCRVHPYQNLMIYNYAKPAQFEKRWNDVTIPCRGLIVDLEQNVIARPFPKFFNYGEVEWTVPLDTPVVATDKVDGSLGVLYIAGGAPYIATRGAFESPMAVRANTILYSKYLGWMPPEGVTPLFEIIYPENRIVLNYGDMEDLILLGGVEIETGKIVDPEDIPWSGPVVEKLPCRTMQEALELPPRENAEGIVVRLKDDRMLKIKQEDYIQLHRIVTGLNERVVWEAVMENRVGELLRDVPEEFQKWIQDTETRFLNEASEIQKEIFQIFSEISFRLGEGFSRREFADAVKGQKYAGFLFKALDKRDFLWDILRTLRPKGVL